MTMNKWILPKSLKSINHMNSIESRRNFIATATKGFVGSILLGSYLNTARAANYSPVRPSDVMTCADTYDQLATQEMQSICTPDELQWIKTQYTQSDYYYIDLGNDSHSRFSVPIRFKFSSKVLYLGNGRYMRIDQGIPFIDIKVTPRESKDINLSEAIRINLIRNELDILVTPCGWRLYPTQKDIEQLARELKSFEPVEGKKTSIKDVDVNYVRPHFDGKNWGKSFGITNKVTGNPFKNFLVTQIPMDKEDFERQKAFDRQGQLNKY